VLHLTGAAVLVPRGIKLLQRPRQVSLVVGPTSDKGLVGVNGGSMGAQGRPHAHL